MAEIRVNATGELKLYDSDDSNYVSFKSAGTVSSDVAWTLPSADGSNGQVLTTNGSGTLSWATASSADPSSADGDSLGTASAEWSDLYLADGGIIYLGNDQDIRLTHNADKGLIIKHSATADDKPVILTLQTGETDMAADDVIGKIEFQAPDEGTGTDAVLVSGAIQAVAEGDHSSSSNATSLQFMTGASEAATAKMHIKSDGKVGIGEGTPLGTLHVYAGNSTATSVQSNSTALVVEGAANAGIQLLSTNDEVNTINFGDPDDPNIGNIQYDHNNNRMVFVTNAVERLRIASDGEVSINDGQVDTNGTVFKAKGAVDETTCKFYHGSTSGNQNLFVFYDGAVENCGSISINTAANTVAYNTSSDYRLKENETAITDGITRLKQLKPYRFNWKADSGGDKVDGFFAHEVSSIVPEAIHGEKDAMTTDDDGKSIINPQQIDQAKLVPLLTAAMIELEARVKTLEDA